MRAPIMFSLSGIIYKWGVSSMCSFLRNSYLIPHTPDHRSTVRVLAVDQIYRQNFSCGVYISTNESKVNFFNAIMYPSFEGSDRGGGGGQFLGRGGQLFTWCFSIHKESVILYPRISSCVLAPSCFLPCDIGQYTHRWAQIVLKFTISHFSCF